MIYAFFVFDNLLFPCLILSNTIFICELVIVFAWFYLIICFKAILSGLKPFFHSWFSILCVGEVHVVLPKQNDCDQCGLVLHNCLHHENTYVGSRHM